MPEVKKNDARYKTAHYRMTRRLTGCYFALPEGNGTNDYQLVKKTCYEQKQHYRWRGNRP